MLLAYTALGTLSKPRTGRRRSGRGRSTGCATASCISEGAARAGAGGVRAREGAERADLRRGDRAGVSSFDAYSVTKPDPEGRGGGAGDPVGA